MTDHRHPRRNDVVDYEHLERRVEPEPVRRQARPVRQAHRAGGCSVVAGLVGFLVVLFVIAAAAPRPGPAISPSPTQAGAPHVLDDRAGVVSGVPREADEPSGTVGSPGGAPLPAAITISGVATWYCGAGQRGTRYCTVGYGPDDLVAAIDRGLGIPKSSRVRVTYAGDSVVVRIVDVCACGGARVIDLTSGAFRRLAPLGAGVLRVHLEVFGPRPTLPPTDVEDVR